MNIQYFKEKFIDVMKDDDFVLKPTIELQSGDFGSRRWAMVYDLDISDDTLIFKAKENIMLDEIYKFEDFSIFNSINNVVFKLNDAIIKDFKLVDTAWSDRVFVFETDFNEYDL